MVLFGEKQKKVWRVIPLCMFWSLWKERNRRAFKTKEIIYQSPKSIFLCNLLLWVRMYIDEGSQTMIDFIDWLGLHVFCLFMHLAFFFSWHLRVLCT